MGTRAIKTKKVKPPVYGKHITSKTPLRTAKRIRFFIGIYFRFLRTLNFRFIEEK
jgi:hypothetical protein